MTHDPHPERARLDQADSLRGLAALTVVLHHIWLTGLLPAPTLWVSRAINTTPLSIVAEGRFPVILFFVLSGVVLTRALDRPRPWSAFALARLCRIWLPVGAMLVLAALVSLSVGVPALPGPWASGLMRSPEEWGAFLQSLALPGVTRDTLNPVVWSLAHELRLSLLMPILLMVARRRFRTLLLGALALHLAVLVALPSFSPGACDTVRHCRPFWGGSLAGSVALDGYFLLFFVIGIGVERRLRAPRPWSAADTALAALTLLAMNGHFLSSDLLFGAGAAILVWLVCARRSVVLGHTWMRRLGRVSYSLYLVHVPVLLTLAGPLRRVLPDALVAVCLVPLAIVGATVFFVIVEAPAHRLARRVGRSVETDAIALGGRPLGVLD